MERNLGLFMTTYIFIQSLKTTFSNQYSCQERMKKPIWSIHIFVT